MAARKRQHLAQATRDRIQASMIINRLEGHINGAIDLKASQVQAALGLLKKVIPDLAAVEHSGSVETKNVDELSNAELQSIITRGRGQGIADEEGSERVPAEVH